jgi:DNA-binding MarR family transcriptional regulator
MTVKHIPLLDLVESLGRLAAGERRRRAVAAGLQPVHVQALEYLRRCNRYSNTPQALADYLGLTKGTVSQSLQLLERKGLIARQPDEADRRVLRLVLTADGETLVGSGGEPAEWSSALAGLSAEAAGTAAATLARLLATMQRRRDGLSFGACHSCRHFRQEETTAYRCGLTGEPLDTDDSRRICREHAWPEASSDD